MIGCFGTDFTYSHDLITRYTDWIFESIAIPELEQRHVQTDVCWIECFVNGDFFEEAGEVFDVVHL